MQAKSLFRAAVVAAIAFSGSSASAGEWKGTTNVDNPQRTPIHDLFWNEGLPSICAFSGLNDEFYLDGDDEATRTQSYGTLVSTDNADPHAFNPGVACNEGQGQ